MKTWVGAPESKLIARWGVPDRKMESGGKTVLTWDGRKYGKVFCVKNFVISEAKLVESYSTDCDEKTWKWGL